MSIPTLRCITTKEAQGGDMSVSLNEKVSHIIRAFSERAHCTLHAQTKAYLEPIMHFVLLRNCLVFLRPLFHYIAYRILHVLCFPSE